MQISFEIFFNIKQITDHVLNSPNVGPEDRTTLTIKTTATTVPNTEKDILGDGMLNYVYGMLKGI